MADVVVAAMVVAVVVVHLTNTVRLARRRSFVPLPDGCFLTYIFDLAIRTRRSINPGEVTRVTPNSRTRRLLLRMQLPRRKNGALQRPTLMPGAPQTVQLLRAATKEAGRDETESLANLGSLENPGSLKKKITL